MTDEKQEPKINTITFGIEGIPYSQITLDASDPDAGVATALSWHIAYTSAFDELAQTQSAAQEIRVQQDAAAVAPQVTPEPVGGHMVEAAVAMGGQERCPDHPDREPKPSQYGGTFCTFPFNPPQKVEYPDGTVKVVKFCTWKSQVK